MEFTREKEAFVHRNANGQLLAEITWVILDEHTWEANHTFVDPSLRGQGVAKQLVDALVDVARSEHKKIKPTCPYIVKLFEKDTSYSDVAV